MNKYIPNTPELEGEMLRTMGLDCVDRLFDCIPDSIKQRNDASLPLGLSDLELEKALYALSKKNVNTNDSVCFIGAGAYDRYVPAVVKTILRRQEFLTSYTPYQGEASQGWLQAMFEYQSLICNLTGMDGANASLYDGGSALAEAVALSASVQKKKNVLVSGSLNPRYRQVLETYTKYRDLTLIDIPVANGVLDIESIKQEEVQESGCLIVQNPNYFGCLENMDGLSEFAKKNKLHFIVSVNPISLGLLKSPGDYDADIVTGEGQELGNGLTFGGPYLGFFAVAKPFLRKLPGRIVGKTVDTKGNEGFVLTMQAREQHIRRERAGSNICSNQALNALAAAVYLVTLGKEGLKEVAMQSHNKARYLYEGLVQSGLFKEVNTAPFFNEFLLRCTKDAGAVQQAFLKKNIFLGHRIHQEFEHSENDLLIAVTEKRAKEEMDDVIQMAGDMK